ncbi:SRPBCC domain-containing protein [Actinopolymorpha pittospori]
MADPSSLVTGTQRRVFRFGRSRGLAALRHYDAAPEEVWNAWTGPVRLARWLGEVTGDRREGGTVRVNLGNPGEPDAVATCRVLRCDPPRRLTATWSFPGERDSAVDLRLQPDGTGSTLRLEHVGLAQARLGLGAGWEVVLLRLGEFLQGADPARLPWSETETALAPLWSARAEVAEIDERWPSAVSTTETSTLECGRDVAAPAEEVWAAATDPSRLARWFASVEGEQRVGGAWTATFSNGKAHGVVEECVPGERLVTSWRWDHEPAGATPARVTLGLHPSESGTSVTLTQRGPATPAATGLAAGWYAHLAGLASYLGGSEPAEADWNADFALARAVLRDQ